MLLEAEVTEGVLSWFYSFTHFTPDDIQVITAIAALIISFIEIVRFANESNLKKQKQEKLLIIGYEIHFFYSKYERDVNTLNALENINIDYTNTTVVYAKKFIEHNIYKDIKEYFDIISKIYSLFLEFEDDFPLSNGFGRYIDAFRKTMIYKKEFEKYSQKDIPQELYQKIICDYKAKIPYMEELKIKYDALENVGKYTNNRKALKKIVKDKEKQLKQMETNINKINNRLPQDNNEENQ